MYVLAIDLFSAEASAHTIWRFPDTEAAALEQWYHLQSLADFGGQAKDCGENVTLKAARLYLAPGARDQHAAHAMVLAGLRPLKTTDDPLAALSEQEAGPWGDALAGRARA
jgi:hypothetical protein